MIKLLIAIITHPLTHELAGHALRIGAEALARHLKSRSAHKAAHAVG